MAKPILVTRLPKDVKSTQSPDEIYRHLVSVAPDYNHITLFEGGLKKLTFEVFNVQDYKQIDFNKLREELCKKENIKS